jgi:hypothetical protein
MAIQIRSRNGGHPANLLKTKECRVRPPPRPVGIQVALVPERKGGSWSDGNGFVSPSPARGHSSSLIPGCGSQEEAVRANDEGGRKRSANSTRICPGCGQKKDPASFLATIDGKTCRLAICLNCRAEQSKRFHRERKQRRAKEKV